MHLAGRGAPLVDMFGIGGAGLMQVASRAIHGARPDPAQACRALVLFLAAIAAAGLLLQLRAQDSTDQDPFPQPRRPV